MWGARGGGGQLVARRWGLIALSALGGLAALGVGWQQMAARADLDTVTPTGRMVLLGEHRMHIDCRGEGDGPTVVLEAGIGGFSAYWAWVVAELSRSVRVCAYDRRGLGWSEPGDGVPDTITTIRMLNRLLDASRERAPYVVVGHGLGGAFARTYAARYRQQVAGAVLVDAMHPDQLERMPQTARQQFADLRVDYRVAQVFAHFGLMRLSNMAANMAGDLPQEARAAIRAFAALPGHLAAASDEVALLDESLAQARTVRTLGDLPLLVVTAERNQEVDGTAWNALQEEQVRLSERGRRVVIAGADEATLLTDHTSAAKVAQAIAEFVAAIPRGAARRPVATDR
jgi:pimeloyl-ACP methyl ester carboxylesterase